MQNVIKNPKFPCPFCGNDELKIDKISGRSKYTSGSPYSVMRTYAIKCTKCHSRGPAITGNVALSLCKSLPTGCVSDNDLENQAMQLWNNRDYTCITQQGLIRL